MRRRRLSCGKADTKVGRYPTFASARSMPRLGFAQKLQSVPRFELRHPVHEVTLVVPGRDRLVLRTARLGASREKLGNLNEIVFESRLADDFEQPGRLIGRIPERVGDTARLVYVSAGSRLGHFVPHSNPDTALENVRQL